jgi:anti-anti-sigma regulatory factor
MLKITQSRTVENSCLLTLEGGLHGPWVDELRRVASARADQQLALDLTGLTFVDGAGERLLRELLAQRAELRGRSPFVANLLGLDLG